LLALADYLELSEERESVRVKEVDNSSSSEEEEEETTTMSGSFTFNNQ